MLAEPHQYLAKIYPRYDLHQFIQDVADQEVRIFSRVVVDLEYLPIAVDRTCARVAAKAKGGVATFPYVLKLVARPDELRRRACARQHKLSPDIVSASKRLPTHGIQIDTSTRKSGSVRAKVLVVTTNPS